MRILEEKQDKVEESSLSRIYSYLSKDDMDFGVVSAFDKDLSFEENMKRHKELASKIRSAHYGYIEQIGGYLYKDGTESQEERSYFIPKISYNECLHFANIYEQETFIYKNNDIFGLYNAKGNKLISSFKKDISFSEKDYKNAYSELVRANMGNKVKFAYLDESK